MADHLEDQGVPLGELSGNLSEMDDNGLSDLLDSIQNELADRYEADERAGRKTHFTLQAIRDLAKGRLPQVTLEGAMEEYERAKATGEEAKDHQRRNRMTNLQVRLIACLGTAAVQKGPLVNLRRAQMNAFRDFLKADGLSPSSIDRRFHDLKAIINWAMLEHDLKMTNPASRMQIEGAAHDKNQRHPFTEEDLRILNPVMETGDDFEVIWELLRDTGARGSEVVGLRVSVQLMNRDYNSTASAPLAC